MRMLFAAATAAFVIAPVFAATATESEQATQARLDALEQELMALKAARTAAVTGSGNQFNPAMSLILQGTFADYSIDPEDYGLAGFAVGEEAGLGRKQVCHLSRHATDGDG